MGPAFVGIDLAWSGRGRTGLAAVDDSGALLASASVRSDAEIDRWLEECGQLPVVVAVDAPLVVVNETGQRACERLVSSAYGAFGASCHPSNLGRPWFDPPRGQALAQRHGWDLDPARAGSVHHPACIEVYPHPAMVVLFGLERVIPYKRKAGRDPAFRRAAFLSLLAHMDAITVLRLGSSGRWTELCRSVRFATRHVELDRAEDEIDAVVCAHLAWRWHHDRDAMAVYGDRETGCIVIPSRA